MSELERRTLVILRAALFVDGAVFLIAALLNFGANIPLGLVDLNFPVPIWQAGTGEAVIGLALLAGAATGRASISWVALCMSLVGIVFGLSSSKVQGPARDIHILLVPLAAIVLGLLVWLRLQSRRPGEANATLGSHEVTQVPSRDTRPAQWQPISIVICGLMVVATGAFMLASIVHFGFTIVLGPVTIYDPFPGAAIPEAIIAVVLGTGSLALIAHWPGRWWIALGATLFALLLTIFGLTITLGSSRTGDITYHITILAVSVLIAGLLLLPIGRHGISS